jgi:DNA-binding transcriptional MerR regulator
MSQYSIAELEMLSGVKAHTIRIWEQRYSLLEPHRTETNIRYYDDDQLVKILNVATLLNGGMKISHVSKLTTEEIKQKISEVTLADMGGDLHAESLINQIVVAGLTFDQAKFEHAFSSGLTRYGIFDTYFKLIYPAMSKVGLLWVKDDMFPAQEHFISALVRQKLCTAIDSLPLPHAGSNIWVLFLPEGEDHELGLLFAHYLIRGKGDSAIYLGQRVPMPNLKSAISETNATHLMMFLVRNHPHEETSKLVASICDAHPQCTLVVACRQDQIPTGLQQENLKWVTDAKLFAQTFFPEK